MRDLMMICEQAAFLAPLARDAVPQAFQPLLREMMALDALLRLIEENDPRAGALVRRAWSGRLDETGLLDEASGFASGVASLFTRAGRAKRRVTKLLAALSARLDDARPADMFADRAAHAAQLLAAKTPALGKAAERYIALGERYPEKQAFVLGLLATAAKLDEHGSDTTKLLLSAAADAIRDHHASPKVATAAAQPSEPAATDAARAYRVGPPKSDAPVRPAGLAKPKQAPRLPSDTPATPRDASAIAPQTALPPDGRLPADPVLWSRAQRIARSLADDPDEIERRTRSYYQQRDGKWLPMASKLPKLSQRHPLDPELYARATRMSQSVFGREITQQSMDWAASYYKSRGGRFAPARLMTGPEMGLPEPAEVNDDAQDDESEIDAKPVKPKRRILRNKPRLATSGKPSAGPDPAEAFFAKSAKRGRNAELKPTRAGKPGTPFGEWQGRRAQNDL